LSIRPVLMAGFFSAQSPETPTDLSQLPIYASRMDDDREAYEFSYALYLARQVDRDAAQMIVQAAEAGMIQINHATDLLMQLSRQSIKHNLFR